MKPSELQLDLYRKMYLIRAAELQIQKHYCEDEMKTPMHMSMGAEAIAAGICHALSPQDQVLATYRSHGVYLAKSMETDQFFAEMYGKADGCSSGKAGSMHLFAPQHGLICTSAIVASHISVAVGAAFANKAAGNGRAVAAFFGDGAIDEGAFWESMNFACLKKLPAIFVCEDNGYAVHTPTAERHGYRAIAEVISQFDCNVFTSSSTDVDSIYAIAREALHSMENNQRPCFLHLKYYRYLEHVGVFEDFKAGYRSKDAFDTWVSVDPLQSQRSRLLSEGAEVAVIDVENAIDQQVNASLRTAQAAPYPDPASLCEGVFA